jgi:hypothetical protein
VPSKEQLNTYKTKVTNQETMKVTVEVFDIQEISEKVHRFGKNFRICATFRSQCMLLIILTKTKPKNEI